MTNQPPIVISVNKVPNRDIINSLELISSTDATWHGRLDFIEAGPTLENIKRLEAALQKCKEQRDEEAKRSNEQRGNNYNYSEEYNAELESILEGRG